MGSKKKPASAAASDKALTGLFAEISKVVGFMPDTGEAYAEIKGKDVVGYAVRASDALSKLNDDQFGVLSEASQKWFDAAVDGINKNDLAAIPKMSGFPVSTAKPTAVAAPAVEAAKPAAKPAAKKEAKKPAPAKAKKPAATPKKVTAKAKPAAKKAAAKAPAQGKLPGTGTGGKARVNGVTYKIRVAVIKNPSMAFLDACKKADADPKIGGHAHNIYNHVRAILRIQKAIGAAA